jgi:aspartyl-tRNA(Asn)/glutamyl-tRNA(Gln) amidotransferase subunit C
VALSQDDVMRVAKLARLSLTSSEVSELTSQLGQIVSLVDQLGEVNTDNVEPMVHAFDSVNVLAPDVPVPSLSRSEALQNAPAADSECFRVPAVLG